MYRYPVVETAGRIEYIFNSVTSLTFSPGRARHNGGYSKRGIVEALIRIKRLVIARKVLFTEKADLEMARDALTPELVYEAILNAPVVFKTIQSRRSGAGKTEWLYIIKGLTFDGLAVYTKGKILKYQGSDVFYVLISSKKSTDV